jgi:hypothetical protein
VEYANPYPLPAVIADAADITVPGQGVKATMNSSLPGILSYNGTRLFSMDLVQNNQPIPRTESEINITPIFAKYKLIEDGWNISTYFYMQRSEVWFTLRYGTARPRLTLTAQLYPYPNYFANNRDHGSLNYSEQTCANLSTDSIDLYGGSGFQLLFDQEVNISLCAQNTSRLSLNATFFNVSEFRFILHEGDYQNRETRLHKHVALLGSFETLTGVRWENVTAANATSHTALKQRWSIPLERDFSFIIKNASQIFLEHNMTSPPKTQVYALTEPLLILGQDGSTNSTSITYRAW